MKEEVIHKMRYQKTIIYFYNKLLPKKNNKIKQIKTLKWIKYKLINKYI